MIIQFNLNIQFTKLINGYGHLRGFNFQRGKRLLEELFTADADDGGR